MKGPQLDFLVAITETINVQLQPNSMNYLNQDFQTQKRIPILNDQLSDLIQQYTNSSNIPFQFVNALSGMFLQLGTYVFFLTQTSLEYFGTIPSNIRNSLLVLNNDVFCTNGQSIFQFNQRLKQFQKISMNQNIRFFQFGENCFQWKVGTKIEVIKSNFKAEILVKTSFSELVFNGGGILLLKELNQYLVVDMVNCRYYNVQTSMGELEIVRSFCGVSLSNDVIKQLLPAQFISQRQQFFNNFMSQRHQIIKNFEQQPLSSMEMIFRPIITIKQEMKLLKEKKEEKALFKDFVHSQIINTAENSPNSQGEEIRRRLSSL